MRIRVWKCVLPVMLSGFFLVDNAFAQQAAPGSWAGWARCVVSVQGQGYTDQQTHTWLITPGAPTVQGAFQIHEATWSVVGRGSLSRSQGSQSLTAQWATNGSEMSAPIAVFVRASDGRMFIQARHAQLRSRSAIQGFQQQSIGGVPRTPVGINAEAFEWAFPLIPIAAVPPSRSATAIGSSMTPSMGSVGVMQPAGSSVTAACTWNFGQGDAAPAPPAVLAAQPVPTPHGPLTASTPPAGTAPPATSAATNSAPPSSTPPTATPGSSSTSPPVTTPVTAPATPLTTSPVTPPTTPPDPPANPPASTLVATPLAPGALPVVRLCNLRGPPLGAGNYATPGSAHLRWDPVAGATDYTVSRSDLGVLNDVPIPPTNSYYSHTKLLPHPRTYVYTIIANYPEGCGRTDITLQSRAPESPDLSYELSPQPGIITLRWRRPFSGGYREGENAVSDYTGLLFTGPGLPAAGRVVLRGSVGQDEGVEIHGVPAGTRTWTVKAYWDVGGGRIIDPTGQSVTAVVP